ncbi:hypothetical protein NT6N_14370 [Oceaniferula spumae]|uniref:ABC transporter permease n=1 Tax=Oceaniferula spumae TaxID=2979115 RepID=A0AAT9FKE1_9BACT
MSSIKHIADFPDKLNPMLVKELRQGLRGVGFVILFITLQAFLAFILLVTAASASSQNAGHLLSRVIFFFFSFAVLIVQPLRGISALSSEVRGNTIDLLCLTRLSAWRITFGKWISIVSQSALILTAIIPYLILRYFFGDMQMLAEVLFLLSIFLISITLTAFTVGFSGISSTIVRVLLPITGALMLFIYIWALFVSNRYLFQTMVQRLTLDTGSAWLGFLAFVVMCLYAGWMCLDLGTSQIAPVAENRSTLKRSVSLFFIMLALAVVTLAIDQVYIAIILGLCLCAPISLICLTENPHLVPPIAAPFVSKGMVGRTLGRIFYPGWATGLIYVLILFLLMQGVIFIFSLKGATIDDTTRMMVPAVFAMLLFPVAMTRLFARKNDNRFGLFVLFICTQALVFAVVISCEQWASNLELMHYFCWIPLTLPYLAEQTIFSSTTLLNIAYLNAGVYYLIALATTRPVWRQVGEVERQIQPAFEA